jgi:putative tricarboxylic transport membrane protein
VVAPVNRQVKRLVCALGTWAAVCAAGTLDGARCVVPAKPGGGFDLTCQLARDSLQAAGLTRTPLQIGYQPGGIGALAFRSTVNQTPADARTVMAFSSGSLLNLAQGRFGPYQPSHVRWLAAVGMDHGVVAVRRDSPYRTLGQLLEALRARPEAIVFGAGGSIGSQDWMKAALLARAAGVGHKAMRFVAFEGGGEALSALKGDHVQVLAGDAAEVGQHIDKGFNVRVLATLSEHRLPGRWSAVPTAKEQGYDIRWPILRGFYMGPGVAERDLREWADTLGRALQHPAAASALARSGITPAWVTGAELDRLVQTQVAQYREQAAAFGLVRP